MLDSQFELLAKANRVLVRMEALDPKDRDRAIIVLNATQVYAAMLSCLRDGDLSESDHQRMRSVLDRIEARLRLLGEVI